MTTDLSQLISELNENERQRNWSSLYMELLAMQEQLDYTIDAATSKQNMCKNRYRDVLPSDEFRVRLNRHPDYINANRCVVPLEGLKICKSYIMSQGPMEETSGDFWEMVWQEKCKNIVMLTNTIENRMMKCHQYFADINFPKTSYSSVLGTFTIRLIEERKSADFAVRKMSLEISGSPEVRTVTHFHYTGWPDHGVPEDPVSFVKFFFFLSSLNALPCISTDKSESEDLNIPPPPPVLHCSAGIGRTGVLCVVDSCYTMLSNGCIMNMSAIINIIMSLRRCRKGAVQTPEQLRFVFFAVCAVGQALADKTVDDYIADAESSLEVCTKKSKTSSVVKPKEEPNKADKIEEESGRSSDSANSKDETSTVPARRSLDSRLAQLETESKRRRTNFLSQNWYFWALTKIQEATGNRQGLAVVTFFVAAFAVGVGFWKRS